MLTRVGRTGLIMMGLGLVAHGALFFLIGASLLIWDVVRIA